MTQTTARARQGTRSRPPTTIRVAPTGPGSGRATLVDRSAELTDEVLASMEHLQRTTIAAVRLVLDTVDEMLPAFDRPSSRESAINAVMDVTDTLVTAQYELLRGAVRTVRR